MRDCRACAPFPPIYALFLLETLVWIAMVPLAPTFADEFGLSGVETGMILAAASLAALVVAFRSACSPTESARGR